VLALAVIPAPRVYFKVVAFEKLVVYFEYNWERERMMKRIFSLTFNFNFNFKNI